MYGETGGRAPDEHPATAELISDRRLNLVAGLKSSLTADIGAMRTQTTVALVGEGGIGKSTLAAILQRQLREAGVPTALVSLGSSTFRSPLRLLASLAYELDRDQFSDFLALVRTYQDKSELLRRREFSDIVTVFTTRLAAYAKEAGPVVILLDHLDAVGADSRKWIMTTVADVCPQIRVVVSTRDIRLIESAQVVELGPFAVEEIDILLGRYGLSATNGLGNTISTVTGGNPIRTITIVQAMAEHPEFVVAPGELFDDVLLRRLALLPTADRVLLGALAIAKSRFTHDIFARILERQHGIEPETFYRLARLPFVVDGEVSVGYRLHDDFVRAVGASPACRVLDPARFVDALITEYYDIEILVAQDSSTRRQLASERAAYRLRADPVDGLDDLRREVEAALDRFDFDATESLLSAADNTPLSETMSVRVALMRAEYLLRRFDSLSAAEALEAAAPRVRQATDPAVRAKHLELTARCVANPVPVPHGDILQAVSMLRESLLCCDLDGLTDQARITAFWLASALRATGQSDAAIASFRRSYDSAAEVGDHMLAVRCLEEQSQTYRLMQDLSSATNLLRDSHTYRVEQNVSEGKGIADYYSGNIYRDSGKFDEARSRYRSAKAFLAESGDDNGLCCLYADWAWLEYLAEDSTLARSLQMESFRLASAYRFGTELAEHWHTMYHLERDAGNLAQAYEYLDMGLAEAKRSSNMYMILDCEMHTAQRALAENNVLAIEDIIEKMEAYERRGCGIRVFRGRTLMLLGAVYFRQQRPSDAYDAWREGLVIVAKFGNSRSNVELFEDIFADVRENLGSVVAEYRMAESFKHVWMREGLDVQFPSVTRLCDEILAGEVGR